MEEPGIELLYVHTLKELPKLLYINMTSKIFAEFCPEPGKHVGQPPTFEVDDDEDEGMDDIEIDPGEYQWAVGAPTNESQLQTV